MLNLEQQNLLRDRYRQTRPGWHPATEVFADLCRSLIDLESTVLDLGCGRGGFFEQLDHPHHKLFGLDLDLTSLSTHRLEDLPRAMASTNAIPLADSSFDLVISSWLLEHLEQPALTFAQIRRVLKPGGAFVFITPNGRHPLALFNRIFGRLTTFQSLIVNFLYGRSSADTFPTRYLANSPDQLREQADHSGLILEDVFFILDPTYLVFSPNMFSTAQFFEELLPENRHTHLVGIMRKKA